jgi:N-methylhydantoinase A
VKHPGSAARFHREHAKVYGYSHPEREVEVVTIRVRARTRLPKPRLVAMPRSTGKPQNRRVWMDGAWRQADVWKREELGSAVRTGPALILDYGSTTVAPLGWKFWVDRAGNLLLEQTERGKVAAPFCIISA